ncbi:ecto-NOX disulfide-thiol exchanger 2 [Topomyia yanbarensis]|uniref:ecto-NOX disulfide-thiol exchanger 2 n=1 Tax=Topomyia yanbarensis TaxID=2498891 RepID=UPI00273BA001|nr:ecto-NOX disulfide-thiol exchanger 2 [Topomyia yanbarensis]
MSYTLNQLSGNAIATMHPIMGAISSAGGYVAQSNSLLSSSMDYCRKQNQMQSGAAPMDLESASERESAREGSSNERKERMVQKAGQLGVDGTGQILFNQLIPQPQGFMMMAPGMVNMMDGSSLIGMQTFPVMTAQQISTGMDITSQAMNMIRSEDGSKELIYCKSCTLFPPSPNSPGPKTIDRPPGCRTVFVGGLPNSVTEEIIREIFERCGEITTLRFSKKNFCHIRYVYEASVDSAIYLSGYRVKLNSGGFNYTTPEPKDPATFGTLHVDYAHARDDQYDYECRQRKLQRERRHREQVDDDQARSSSPQPIIHYTDHEATSISDMLKNDESFAKAVQTLITWLERGDCSKKNANNFYTMIQSTNSHVRRLLSEKAINDEELSRAREFYRKQMQCMLAQFNQIEKVFTAASHKKVWDHFSKAQRKNIDAWKKQSLEIRCGQLEDVGEDEMDVSEDDGVVPKKSRWDVRQDQLDTSSDAEAQSIRSDLEVKTMQIQVLQETIRNLQTQLLDNKYKEMARHTKITELEEKLKEANVKQLLLKTKIAANQSKLSLCTTNTSSTKGDSEVDEPDVLEVDVKPVLSAIATTAATVASDVATPVVTLTPIETTTTPMIDPNEARVITLVSTFLVVHPHGASIDYIWSYVNRYVPELKVKLLEEILQRYLNLFREEVSGIGAKIERNWKFVGYECKEEEKS